jgi:4-amino-4-deoxy-L-arabinose transferase-like glycosyltransferase
MADGKVRRRTRREDRGPRGPRGATGRWTFIVLAAILVLGLVLRLSYLAELRRAPDFAEPFSDAGYHDYWARGLAFGAWTPPPNMADPEIDSSPYLRPPGYPFFLALIYRLTGGSYLAPRIAQAILGLLSAWLAFLIGRRWFGATAGLVAAFFMSAHWAFIYFEGELHAPALLIALLLTFTFLISEWVGGARPWRGLVAGLVLGAAVITRPNVLLFLPAVGAWALWLHRRDDRRRVGSATAALLAGTLLVMLPVTVRNFAVSGEFMPVTSNTGVNLYMGNNPEANGLCDGDLPGIGVFGTCFDYPAVVSTLEKQTGRRLSDAEASNIMTGRALDFVLTNPGEALRLTGRKALLFWGPWEVTHNKVVALERANSGVLSHIPFGFPLLAALGLLGAGLVAAGGRRSALGTASDAAEWPPDHAREGFEVAGLLLTLLAAWFVSILPFFAAARYRLPAVPFLALLAGVGIGWLVHQARARAWRAVGVWVVVFAILMMLASIRFVPYRADEARWHYNRAMSYAASGELTLALPEYREALRINPEHWQAHLDLGVALARSGRIAEGGPHIMDALRLNPANPYVQYNAALLMEAVGELERSERHLLEVLRLSPGFPGAAQDLARVRAALSRAQTGPDGE